MSIASRIESMTEHLTNDWDIVDSLGLYTNKLPKEYTQVDYIESSGTQYIDTGVNADYKLSVKFEFSNLSQNSYQGAMSGGNATNRIRHHLQMTGINNVAYWAGLYDSGCSTIIIAGADYDSSKKYNIFADVYNKKYYLDGIEIPGNFNSNDFDTGLNYYLFGRNTNNGVASMLQMKMYSFQMYYENELVRDFIPCYRNSDNEIGLYDIVNDVFYTNQGTGVFTYGEIQEEHIDRNLENLSLPLKDLYNEVSDKTDISQNGVVGRTSQESTTGKNLFGDTLEVGTINSSGNNSTSTDNMRNADYISVNQQTTYTISTSTNCYIGIRYYNSSKTFLSSGTTAEQPNTFTTPENCKYVRFVFVNITDTTVKVQLEKGSQATPYEEYTGGIPSPNPDYPQPINNLSGDVPYKVSGKNKLPFPYTESTHTHNGVTFTIYNDGSVLVNGTATGGNANIKLYGNYREQEQLKLPSGYLYGGTTNVWLRALNNHGGNYSLLGNDTGEGAEIDTATYDVGYVELTVKNGTTVNNQLIKPMILDSLEDITYEPYISQTFNIPLKSKNLFNGEIETGGWNFTEGDQLIKSTTTHQLRCTNKIIVEPNKEYVFSLNGNQIAENARYIFVDKNNIVISSTVTTTGKVTTPNNCEYLVFHSADLKTKYDLNLPNPMIEKNNVATTYEPYYDIELCKINTYEDKIYSSNGRFYLNKNIGKVVLDGSENWNRQPNIGGLGITRFRTTNKLINVLNDSSREKIISNYFYYLSGGSHGIGGGFISSEYLYLYYGYDGTTVQDFTTWLSTHNTSVYYVLATPTTTEITQENYPSLYNALKQIQDYLTAYKINKEFILGYSSPEIEY